MSADKRTVTTDALETLGMIISENEKRDAIHLAVEPIVAGQTLAPGQHVGLITIEGVTRAYITKQEHLLGIVDPFLNEPVRAGNRFWLVVYPRQINSLRHVWTHPAFPDAPEVAGMTPKLGVDAKAASEAWLRNFIATSDCPSYEVVIAKAVDNDDSWSDEYLHFSGRDAHGDIPPEFWDHVEIVTGSKIPADKRATGFSCSC
jgi:hypothetical protein